MYTAAFHQSKYIFFFFFFFQAEDGIRDYKVTGVQTCALPISLRWPALSLVAFLINQHRTTLQIAYRDRFRLATSTSSSSRHCPGLRSPKVTGPTAMRTRRSVGWPTAAVMRRTCRFCPSRRVTLSQAVGMDLRNLMG